MNTDFPSFPDWLSDNWQDVYDSGIVGKVGTVILFIILFSLFNGR
jgi:hypothetical protein